MTSQMPYSRSSRHTTFFLLWLLLSFASSSYAALQNLSGAWYRSASKDWIYQGQSQLDNSALERAKGVAPTGGKFWFQADFSVQQPGWYVLDFKNSTVIGRFRHFVFDEQGRRVAAFEGGIQSAAENPYFLRHGRDVELPTGRYRLISELESPFFLAQPEPFVDIQRDYRQSIKPGDALVLLCLGIFVGLGIYYTALALVRRRVAEGMYALFILGNLLYNGTALMVFPELFGMHWFYLISLPILFSNCAYILFVMALLEIRRDTQPRLYKAGIGLLALLAGFLLLAGLKPNWSLELDRYGVGVFLMYGLTAGIVRSRQGSVSARLYLVAIAVFFALGAVAISQTQLDGVYTFYIEHVGLLAVAVEVILLALVLSYQFAQLHQEKEHALQRLEYSNRIAYTDALTGLSNRYALDIALDHLPQSGSLTFLDLDGLKYYNDLFGHARGDELLRSFSQQLSANLANEAGLYRLGGDEFAITFASGDVAWIERKLVETMESMHDAGFEFAGVSAGTVHLYEASSKNELKHIADTRMYENKRRRKEIELQLKGLPV